MREQKEKGSPSIPSEEKKDLKSERESSHSLGNCTESGVER